MISQIVFFQFLMQMATLFSGLYPRKPAGDSWKLLDPQTIFPNSMQKSNLLLVFSTPNDI